MNEATNYTPKSLPPGWLAVQLEQVAEIRSGYGFPTRLQGRTSGDIPFAKVSDISRTVDQGSKYISQAANYISSEEANEIRAETMPENSIVFAKIGGAIELNRRVILTQDFIFDNNVMGLTPEYGVEPLYLYYFMLTQHLGQLSRATTVPSVRRGDVGSIVMPLPPLPEQQRITDALEELFSDLEAGVAALKRVQKKLAHYRAAVLRAAVDGSLTAAWRQQHTHTESASELLKHILAERRYHWEEEQLRKFAAAKKDPPKNWKTKYKEPVAASIEWIPSLPKSWCFASIDMLIMEGIVNGISVRGSSEPPGITSLRLDAMSETGFNYEAKRYLPLTETDVEDLWIEVGDFFVSRGNGSKKLIGRGTLAQQPPGKIIFPDTMMRLRLSRHLQATRWIPTIWNSGLVRKQIEKTAKTTAGIWKIAQPDLARISIPLPPSTEQLVIVEMVEDQFSVIEYLESDIKDKLKAAQALRQTILRDAFNGQLVPQDPKDEHASELLKRIDAAREERERQAVSARRSSVRKKQPRKRTVAI
jgi:type I restriction enzyme, S subunit